MIVFMNASLAFEAVSHAYPHLHSAIRTIEIIIFWNCWM